ncbi:AraC family transcriptional regulator [Paraburkholderia sp. 2C]
MTTPIRHLSYRRGPAGEHEWRQGLRAFGIDSRTDPLRSVDSGLTAWNAGQIAVLSADFRHQTITPVSPDESPWTHDHLFLKVVKNGSGMIEQHGQTRVIREGDVVLLDPKEPYREIVTERASGFGLRFPRSALRERGFRCTLRGIYLPDVSSPDVQAVRAFIEYLGQQSGTSSAEVRRRLGDQLLDLLDIVVDDRTAVRTGRGPAAIVFKAKQFIARNVGNADLSLSQIAAHACVSEKHLSRLFAAQGMSLMRYVQSVRMERGARLLAATPWRRNLVMEVAFECGFKTASHFSRAFKERFGVSPREAQTRPAPGPLPSCGAHEGEVKKAP